MIAPAAVPAALLLVGQVGQVSTPGDFEARAPVAAAFGACMVDRVPERARALMDTEIGSRQELRQVSAIVDRGAGCIDRRYSLTLRGVEIRGAIAETLLERDSSRMQTLRSLPERPPERASPAEGWRFLFNYSHCLARARPGKAVAMIESGVGSQSERQAFLDFGQALMDCMPQGVRFRPNIPELRNYIALHLFEMARTSGPPGA